MKKRLYLCRHGQTVFNTMGIAQGRVDSPLTELGKKQAENVKLYLEKNNIKYTAVYRSPLGRAKQTCEIITGVDGISDDGLIEMDFGSTDGLDYKMCRSYKDDFTSIGGESREIAGERMLKSLSNIMQKSSGDVFVVSHATVGRCFYYKVVAYDPEFRIPNCGISIYDYEDGKFSFVELVDPNA